MTEQQFLEWFDMHRDCDGDRLIECQSVDDRADVLQYLVLHGYFLNIATQGYLSSTYSDTFYMHPGLSREDLGSNCEVCCFHTASYAKDRVRYEDLEFLCKEDTVDGNDFGHDIEALFS